MRLLRTMRIDPADGLPVVGDGPRMLGVRVPPSEPADVRPGADGRVAPGAGGMSVTADDPFAMPRHLRPAQFRGTLAPGRGEVCVLDRATVEPPLALRADGPPHHLVEPDRPLPIEEFQGALRATRSQWSVVR